jgi:hypothetical protein
VGQPPDALVEIDARYPAEMAERRALLAARHAEVFGAEPASAAARAETLAVIADLLLRRHPDWFARQGDRLENRVTGESWDLAALLHDPLEMAGRLVAEDLCLIDTSGPAPVLTAAILCAPTRWRLAEKLGRPLAEVHGPVPLYAAKLAGPVDRFMASLRPGRLAERFTWTVLDDPALFQPTGHGRIDADPLLTPETAPDRLFLRVERQTLLRLPLSGAVLFAIRVHVYPLRRVLALPGVAADLAAAIQSLPEPLARYKSLLPIRTPLLACLAAWPAVPGPVAGLTR